MEAIDTFIYFGVETVHQIGDEIECNCIFCGKEGHLHIHKDRGVYNCKVCGRSGNVSTFLDYIISKCKSNTTREDLNHIAIVRGISVEILEQYELVHLRGWEYLLPVRNENGTIVNCKIWNRTDNSFRNTPGCNTHIYNQKVIADRTKQHKTVWICEGEWDTLALIAKTDKVVAIGLPSATANLTTAVPYISGRRVVLALDNDKAGEEGTIKCTKYLKSCVKSLDVVKWPTDAPKGFDVRDYLRDHTFEQLEQLAIQTPKVAPVKFIERLSGERQTTIDKVVDKYREYYDVTEHYEQGIRLALAVVMSTTLRSNQLWLFLVSPPGTGKTTLIYPYKHLDSCVFQSTLTKTMLVSGYKKGPDPSLLGKIDGKCLIIKDFTEVLESQPAERDQVFSILRGAYDGSVSRAYGNQVVRMYNDLRFSMLACVTQKISMVTNSSQGERFLKYRLETELDYDKRIKAAIKLTGREDAAAQGISTVIQDFITEGVTYDEKAADVYLDRIVALAKLVSIVRTEVIKDIKRQEILVRPESELGTRVGTQLYKLLLFLLAVDPTKPDLAYKIVKKTAMDSVEGFIFDIVKLCYRRMKRQLPITPDIMSTRLNIPMFTLNLKLSDGTLVGILKRIKLRGCLKYKYKLKDEIFHLLESI